MQPQPDSITDLVDALLAAGCDLWAFGNGYIIGEPEAGPAAERVKMILEDFGPREPHFGEIVAHLRRIGRHLDDSG